MDSGIGRFHTCRSFQRQRCRSAVRFRHSILFHSFCRSTRQPIRSEKRHSHESRHNSRKVSRELSCYIRSADLCAAGCSCLWQNAGKVRKNCSLKILNGRIGSLKVLNWKICNWKILNWRILNWTTLRAKTGWMTGKMNCVMMKIWMSVSWSFGLLAA